MQDDRSQTIFQRIQAEKAVKYIGAALVKVDSLCFPDNDSPDPRNVARLAALFRTQRGFCLGDIGHLIPAIISEANLRQVLAASGASRDALRPGNNAHVRLDFSEAMKLHCLRGEEHVQAVRAALASPEPWCAVDLYMADISREAKQDLIEEYAWGKQPEDGEFYCKIREYQGIFGQKNSYLESRWWARLAATSHSGHKKERLRQLFGHQQFSRAFDAFQHLHVIYCGLRLSVVNKMISMGCNDELLNYLAHIRAFWYEIFDENESAMEKLDRSSLLALQLTAPGACPQDNRDLQARLRKGSILSAFSEIERDKIWSNLCAATVDCLVPSLYSFFEDLGYIGDAARCMKRLIHMERRQTIRCALEMAYSNAHQTGETFRLQTPKPYLRQVTVNGIDRFDVAYRQLWLYALRKYQSMPPKSKQKLTGQQPALLDETTVFQFATLAKKLGFYSQEINGLLQHNPDREIARQLLMTMRKPDQFVYDDIESALTMVTTAIGTARRITTDQKIDEWEMKDDAHAPVRCGRPRLSDKIRDERHLYLDKLHAAIPSQTQGISSLFVQRSTYFAFFGKNVALPTCASQATGSQDNLVLVDESPVEHIGTESSSFSLQMPRIQIAEESATANNTRNKRPRVVEPECQHAQAVEEMPLGQCASDNQNSPAIDLKVDEMKKLLEVSRELIVRQNELNGLDEQHREKRITMEQLDREEKQRKSIIFQLQEKELCLRQTIDSLEVCLKQIEMKAAGDKI